jgi:hypothetical protein
MCDATGMIAIAGARRNVTTAAIASVIVTDDANVTVLAATDTRGTATKAVHDGTNTRRDAAMDIRRLRHQDPNPNPRHRARGPARRPRDRIRPVPNAANGLIMVSDPSAVNVVNVLSVVSVVSVVSAANVAGVAGADAGAAEADARAATGVNQPRQPMQRVPGIL